MVDLAGPVVSGSEQSFDVGWVYRFDRARAKVGFGGGGSFPIVCSKQAADICFRRELYTILHLNHVYAVGQGDKAFVD
jgi:hypothetical protein